MQSNKVKVRMSDSNFNRVIPVVEKARNAKFVMEVQHPSNDTQTAALFWQEKPPVEGYSNYFLISYHNDSFYISCGQKASEVIRYGFYDNNKEFVHSRNRWDYRQVDGRGAIDGGECYTRVVGSIGPTVAVQIIDGEVYETNVSA